MPKGGGHKKLNDELRRLGGELARALIRSYAAEDTGWVDDVCDGLLDFTGAYDPDRARALFEEVLETGDITRFEDKYRDLFPNTDEHVSTSSVRELIIGMAKVLMGASLRHSVQTQVRAVAAKLLDGLSRIRLPTRVTGFHYAATSLRMQHPTSVKGGLFGLNQKGDGSSKQHSRLDVQRKQHVLDSMKQADALNLSVSEVFLAAAREAIRITLNSMAAPVTARDQILYNALQEDIDLASAWREALKRLGVRLGVDQEPPDPGVLDQETREFGLRMPLGPLSPYRTGLSAGSAAASAALDVTGLGAPSASLALAPGAGLSVTGMAGDVASPSGYASLPVIGSLSMAADAAVQFPRLSDTGAIRADSLLDGSMNVDPLPDRLPHDIAVDEDALIEQLFVPSAGPYSVRGVMDPNGGPHADDTDELLAELDGPENEGNGGDLADLFLGSDGRVIEFPDLSGLRDLSQPGVEDANDLYMQLPSTPMNNPMFPSSSVDQSASSDGAVGDMAVLA